MKMFNSLLAKVTRGQAAWNEEGAEERSGAAGNEIFDNVARTLGSPVPRRQAIKLAALGVAGAALSELGLKSAWAQNCLCSGQLYDPATACCTPSGVQPKHPVANLSACPDRRPHPGHVNYPNGCGAAGGTKYPNRWGFADFGSCCNVHDNCYGTCNSSKGGCDTSFRGCLRDACLDSLLTLLSPGLLASCLAAAEAYFLGVHFRGGGPYESAQRGACDCCGTQTCGQSCVGGTCSSLPSCQDPGCVCFQTIEGNGFCHRPQSCAGLSTCSSSANCPSGWACVSVTCCGPTPICIQPCFVIGSQSLQSQSDGPTTVSPR